MMFLIGQLAPWLLLTAAFAALAGWAFAAQRAAPADGALRRDRDNLVRDIVALASGESGAANDSVEAERELDAVRRLNELNAGRVSELEQALAAARARADEAAAQAAELQRAMDRPAVEVVSAPAEPDPEDGALQSWRLRYFEQRVRYLEGKAREAPAEALAASNVNADPPIETWRARVAEASAEHLAQELRAQGAPAEAGASPFAARADVDVLLRWRMLYLERRVAHLQGAQSGLPLASVAPPAPSIAGVADPDRWKWRARYLEARTRHLEQRLATAPARVMTVASPAAVDEGVDTPPAPAAATRGAKPPVLASARQGAPDDFTLIDGVTLLQQTTLYSIGVFHFDQIAAWSEANVAWVDQYLRLRGRIVDEEWVEQAADLARDGPAAARRVLEDEDL